jgi:hypothetical protein
MGWGGKDRAALALALAAALAAPALGFAGSRAAQALAKLEHGRWRIHSLSQAAVDRSLCLGDAALLFQIEHGAGGCSQQLLAQKERAATVEYVCPGRGFGHTSIRIETPTTAIIETQGMIDGRPFAYRATAKKLSDC